ncbi:hypothetical protein [Paraburkholderia youngii]|uniref:hypothetical protein n=1 Tax=Paraburkholderia youngii TaxID=2782701 RepID=UPI003D248A87
MNEAKDKPAQKAAPVDAPATVYVKNSSDTPVVMRDLIAPLIDQKTWYIDPNRITPVPAAPWAEWVKGWFGRRAVECGALAAVTRDEYEEQEPRSWEIEQAEAEKAERELVALATPAAKVRLR